MTAGLLDHHAAQLEAAAIDLDVAVAAGVRSVSTVVDIPESARWCGNVPGIVFPHHPLDGDPVDQYRPDDPVDIEGVSHKYLWPKDVPLVLAVHPAQRDMVGKDHVLIVEGTKQYLAAVSNAPDDWLVVGIAGCYGWSTAGAPNPDLARLVPDGSEVVVCFDADVASNRNVWDAADGLRSALDLLGVAAVRFARVPGSKTTGLDDYLATILTDDRARVVANLVAKAGKLPRQPAKAKAGGAQPGDEFFDFNGLLAVSATTAVAASGHYALGRDGLVWVYKDGVYARDDQALVAITQSFLGERWRGMHHNTILQLLAADLAAAGKVLGDDPILEYVNVANGLLDIATGELHPHTPEHLSFAQLPTPWDPEATCPRFDAWLVERVGTQAEDLLEATGLVLCPRVAQRKVPFPIGPSRSGKGTYMRVVEGVVGRDNVSAITLHQLAGNRFAGAGLYGKLLNSAGDLSDVHVDDLSKFKELTGGDLVSVERKFGQLFEFRNTALLVFSANTPPTVSETSRAYLNRVRPYLFGRTYEATEDQSVEDGLHEELLGVLVRLAEGARRWLARGCYAPSNPLVDDMFARQSDPVAMFVAQVVDLDPNGFVTTTAAFEAYKGWAVANNRGALGRSKFLARAENTLGGKVRSSRGSGPWGWRGWTLLAECDWKDDETYAQTAAAVEPDPPAPSDARDATVTPTSPHEGCEKEEGRVRERVEELKVGPTPASLASPPPTCEDAPVEQGRMVF